MVDEFDISFLFKILEKNHCMKQSKLLFQNFVTKLTKGGGAYVFS
jgi:hypothetical protein